MTREVGFSDEPKARSVDHYSVPELSATSQGGCVLYIRLLLVPLFRTKGPSYTIVSSIVRTLEALYSLQNGGMDK